MPKRKVTLLEQTLPALYGRIYLSIAAERGADTDLILRQAGLSISKLDNPNGRITYLQMQQLVRTIISMVGDDGIAIEVGIRMPPTTFGNLGQALMCSETLSDVILLCQRFWSLLSPSVNLTLHRGEEHSVVDMTLVDAIPKIFQHLIYEVAMAGFYRGLLSLADISEEDIDIWFKFPSPDYVKKAESLLGNVHYNMPANQFRFRTELFATKLLFHNPFSLNFAIEQCEKELALLRDEGQSIRSLVIEKLVIRHNAYPSVQDISQQLHLTERTLRRRLEDEGTTFKALLDQVKRRDALQLLDNHQITIQQVAEKLGYQDPANFTRAFRNWTGKTPSEYRLMKG